MSNMEKNGTTQKQARLFLRSSVLFYMTNAAMKIIEKNRNTLRVFLFFSIISHHLCSVIYLVLSHILSQTTIPSITYSLFWKILCI